MHDYLRAIGFSNIKSRKDLEKLLKEVEESYDEKNIVTEASDYTFAEISKAFAFDCGITVCGEYDEEDHFWREYYFPYFKGTGITSREDIVIEKHIARDSYGGVCDDVRVGVSLIFYLQNAAKYKNELEKGNVKKGESYITLSGLSTNGMVLFPVLKGGNGSGTKQSKSEERNNLLNAARKGDEEAMENLTIEEIDTYTMISKRIQSEDVFTIVNSYFMPYGMECDCYSVMGDIKDYTVVKNSITDETIYQLTIDCNDIKFDICINEKDLMGEPEVGRRFKGSIWLQGYMNFMN